MQTQSTPDDFSDLKSHKQMWNGYTSFLLRGVIGTIVVVLFVGWVTGVL
jgi:hypothetical protein